MLPVAEALSEVRIDPPLIFKIELEDCDNVPSPEREFTTVNVLETPFFNEVLAPIERLPPMVKLFTVVAEAVSLNVRFPEMVTVRAVKVFAPFPESPRLT